MLITPLSFLLVLFLETLAFSSLWLTHEVKHIFLLIPLAVGILFYRVGLKIKDRWLFVGLAALFTVVGIAIFRYHQSPGTVLAEAVPSFHALVWLSPDRMRFRYWRLGISFFEIILAASLAPEVYMFLFIMLYALLSAFLLSVLYLESSYQQHAPELLNKRLPARLVRTNFILAFSLFIGAAILFPILPRAKWLESYQANRSLVGYSEKIQTAQFENFFETGDSHVVLRLFLTPEVNLKDLRLIRGRALEVYREDTWSPAVKRLMRPSDLTPPVDSSWVNAIREDIGSDILPTSYNTEYVSLENGRSPHHSTSGEWSFGLFQNSRVHYQLKFGKQLINSDDLPREIHLHVPKDRPKIEALAHSIARGQKEDQAKIRAVQAFFANNFTASLNFSQPGLEPVENFLFHSHSGHCELFATSAALLLRYMGLPTRIVAGFRTSHKPQNNILTYYNTDAHAWVEVWEQGKGWTVIDTTPVLYRPDNLRLLDESYEALSAYWYRYVLSYDADAWTPLWEKVKRNKWNLGFLLLFLFSLPNISRFAGFHFQRFLDFRAFPKQRQKAILAFRRKQKRDKNIPQSWLTAYQQLRFGPLLSKAEFGKILHFLNQKA